MAAAANAAPKLSRQAASVRGEATVSQNWPQESVAVFRTRVERGMKTMRVRYRSVNPIARPKPGSTPPGRDRIIPSLARSRASAGSLVDLVEHAAVGEVGLLRPGPAAEDLVDGEQLQRRELLREARGDRLETRPVVVPRGDLLPLRRVQVLEVGLRHRPGPPLAGHLVDHGDRRLGKDADRGGDDLEPSLLQLARR